MKTASDLIQEAAAKGNLTHLSLTPNPDGKGWRASYAPSVGDNSFAAHADPCEAIRLAITNARKRPRTTETELDFG